MPRMIPNTVDPGAVESEKVVFAAMQKQLPAGWVVLHGKRFVLPSDGRRPPIEGEVDFIVLDPSRGYVGLEVKGGGVGRDAEGWFRKYEGRTERIGEPGQQAQRNIHGIGAYLNRQPVFRNIGRGPRYGWGVCLPFLDVDGSLGAELPEEFVIDRSDIDDLPAAMDRLFAANRLDGPPMIPGTLDAWVKALAPAFHLSVSLSSRISDAEAQIFRMTEEQKSLLDNLADVPRVGVKGGAGTGKTVLALELARRWTEEGSRVLFFCYNKPLADEIARTAEGFTVHTFHGLCSSMARSAGLRFSPPKAGDDTEFWETEAPELLSNALDVFADDRFDAVVVDEGQDFREYWWLVIEKLLKDSKESRLWVFYDPNQDLYGGGPVEALSLTPARLTWNCRNTERIANFSASMIEVDVKVKEGAPEGLKVEEIVCADEAAMVDATRKTVHRLIVEDKISADDVIVLSPKASASPVWRAKRLGNLELIEFPNAPGPNQLRFSSLQRFKGLEAKAVVIADVDRENPLCSPKHLYVGTSRAKHLLTVLSYE